MYKSILTLVLIASCVVFTSAVSMKAPYAVFNSKGKVTSFAEFEKQISSADIVLFGELHNNTLGHWLQLQALKSMFAAKNTKLALGMEMLEADDQIVIDEFQAGTITQKHLETEAKLWPNFSIDYMPIFQYANENKVKVVATNIPRRYASMVSKKGLEAMNSLPAEAKAWMAPMPIEVDLSLPGYAAMTKGMAGMARNGGSPDNFAKAQAIKDATMAHFILKNWQTGSAFLHLNGSYHSNNYEGIGWYLKRANPKLKIITINMVEQKELKSLDTEHLNTADFIFAIADDVIKSY